MSVNTANTPDGKGVLIYNGEMILLYSSDVKMSFSNNGSIFFKGNKAGSLYLTTHRIIFVNNKNDTLRSFSMPFHMLQNVQLEQPLLAANYLKGAIQAMQGGNYDGEVTWKLSFPKGGCIEFGQALLRANDLASRSRPHASPPVYQETPSQYYSAPSSYYIAKPNAYSGFQAPTHVFPEQPPVGNVYMFDAPPPYGGIAPTAPLPAGQLQYAGQYQNIPNTNMPPPYPTYNNVPASANPPEYTPQAQAPPLPEKH